MTLPHLTTAGCLAGTMAVLATALPAQTPVPAKVLLRIDAEAENLSAISTLAVSPSGILAVYLKQDGVIRLFSPAGKAVGSAGHTGEGPGEFRDLGAIGWIGDTLWASDRRLQRLTRYAANGKFLRAAQLPARIEQSVPGTAAVRYTGARLQAVYPDGSLMLQVMLFKPPLSDAPKDVMGDPRFAVRATPEGAVRTLLATDPPNLCMIAGSEMIISMPASSCPMTLRATPPNASRRVAVLQETSPNGTGSIRVVAVNDRGETLFEHRRPVRLMPVPSEAHDRQLKEVPSDMRELVAARSRFFPPAFEVQVAPNGTTWVGLYTPANTPREWLRFDPNGKPMPSIWLPASAKGLAIDRRGAWAITETEDGAQSITLFEARP